MPLRSAKRLRTMGVELCRLDTVSYICHWTVLRRNLVIACLVGSLLSIVNQGAFILEGSASYAVIAKIAANYLIPFSVSSISAAVNRQSDSHGQ